MLELLNQEMFDDAVVNFDGTVDAITDYLNDPAVLHRVQSSLPERACLTDTKNYSVAEYQEPLSCLE